jgi:enoyl-CoA hydratase
MIESRDLAGVRVLTLAHGKANTLDLEILAALQSALETAASSEEVDAVVLTGKERIFSAGVDLFRVVNGGREYVEVFLPALSSAINQLFALPKPVIAAVNGHAIAGGCILACACDVKIGVHGSGVVGVPELQVGVPFPVAALEVVRFAVGPENLSEVTLGGKTYSPEKALSLGLLDHLVDADELIGQALEHARRLAGLGARAFALTKQQIRRDIATTIHREGRQTDFEVLEMWSAPETLAKIRDYLDRTLGRRQSPSETRDRA